ncbi:hypothetical protein RvY_09120 [Ramazzottius varieornatus]|uniref:Uncharacterized protein n=1 Tax=Ramazzottius varieornatus TaxID=947166 RepID=A0A1D1VDT2_RAMVA|nr:hypothetical protein RvY_09120 [Ramazzottius varieornatus]
MTHMLSVTDRLHRHRRILEFKFSIFSFPKPRFLCSSISFDCSQNSLLLLIRIISTRLLAGVYYDDERRHMNQTARWCYLSWSNGHRLPGMVLKLYFRQSTLLLV